MRAATGADEPYDKLKRALRADIDESAWSSLYSTTSRPFAPPDTGKIAVKVINHYGDEVLKVDDSEADEYVRRCRRADRRHEHPGAGVSRSQEDPVLRHAHGAADDRGPGDCADVGEPGHARRPPHRVSDRRDLARLRATGNRHLATVARNCS